MPDFNDITKWFQDTMVRANQQKEQQSIDALKAKNEGTKLELNILKTQADIQKNKEKDQVEAQKIRTETIGLEHDNRDKKLTMIERMLGQVVPGAGASTESKPERKPAMASNAEPVTPSAPLTTPKPPDDKPLPVEKAELEEVKLKPSPVKKPVPELPPPPYISPLEQQRSRAWETWDQQIAQEDASIGIRNDIIDANEESLRILKKSKAQYEKRINQNMFLQEQLANEAPTYQSALSNVNWLAKITSVLDASMLGHLRESPTYLIDQFVAKELQSQTTKYKAQMGMLEKKENAYEKFYNLSNDEYEAELGTLAFVYKATADNLKAFAKIADTEEKKMNMLQMIDNIEHKRMITEKKLGLSIMKTEQEKADKEFNKWLKARKDTREQAKLGLDLAKLDVSRQKLDFDKKKEQRIIDAQTIKFGGKDFTDVIDPKVRSKATTEITASRRSFQDMRAMKTQVDKIGVGTGFKAFLAKLPGEWLDEDKALFDNINKGLINTMLANRIKFTGGGNMSDKEQDRLKEFYNVSSVGGIRSWVLKSEQEIAQIIMKKWHGKYKQLMDLIKRDAFFNAFDVMDRDSNQFKSLSKLEQFNTVRKEFNLTKEEAEKYYKEYATRWGLP